MTAEEAKNKSFWNKLPLDIRHAIENAVNSGYSTVEVNELTFEQSSILQNLGYFIYHKVRNKKHMIQW